MTLPLRLSIAAVLLVLLAPGTASAGLGTWTNLPGLNDASGASWIREYATGTPPTTLYAATEGGGVYRSANDGLSWSPINAGLDSVPGAMIVRTVFTSGSTVYAGTQAGLFSFNGSGWTPVAQGPEENPAAPKKLNRSVQTVLTGVTGQILAGTFAGGVYKSTDGGATWTPPSPGNGMPTNETVWGLASLAPNVIFAATSSGLYRSVDFGSSWTPSNDGVSGTTLRVFADGHNPNIYYAGTAGDGVFRSINLGVTWSAVSGPVGHALGNLTVRGLKQFAGLQETRLYAGTGAGLYAGTTGNGPVPGAVSWRKVTESGLSGQNIFWALSSFTTTPGTLLAGTQSNGGYALTFQPPANIALPTVGGTPPQEGKPLTATHGTWSGTPTIEYSYQWQRCPSGAPPCVDIDDAVQSTYVPTLFGASERFRVVVTAENDFPTFSKATAASAITAATGANANPTFVPGWNQVSSGSITALPPGDGVLPQSGDTLHAQAWLFNPAATSTSFQWFYCDAPQPACDPISGATAQNYVLTDEDVGHRLAVKVTGTNAFGSTTLNFSGNTNVIFPEQATNVKPPTITGLAYVGESLVGSVGQWKYPGTTYKRQWYQCGADGGSCATISGEKGPAYTPRADDVGHTIKLIVTADSNGDNTFPGPVDAATGPTGVITLPPAPGPPPPPPPPPPGGPSAGDVTAPVLQALKATAKLKQGAGLKISYALSEPGRLSVTVTRSVNGHRKGKKCVPGRKRGARKCTAAKRIGSVTLNVPAGAGKLTLPARIGGKKLTPGRYTAIVTPVDAAGNRGTPKSLKFRVIRRR